MNVQARYWQELSDLKRNSVYLDLYHAKTENIDRYLNMFSAFMSSSSIAAWAIWQQYQFVWGTLIALTQVLQAIKAYIPYNKRLKNLSSLSPEMGALQISAESDWYRISKGYLTEDEINTLQTKLKKKCLELTNKYFPNSSLPESKGLVKKADRITQEYLATYFGV